MKRIILALFLLLPGVAAGQGSIGPGGVLWVDPGFRGPRVDSMIRAGDQAFFSVTAFFGRELWRTDGTPQGTSRLATMGQNIPGDQEIRFWSTAGPRVFFTRPGYPEGQPPNRELWRSDGTVESTVPLVAGLSFAIDAAVGDAPTSLAVPELGLVFFSAGAQGDYELWATDGTAAGTRLVENVNPAGPSNPGSMATLGGELFFLADLPGGKELWRSDGTPEGTERVAGLGAGKFVLVRAGEELFLLRESAAGLELWRGDGTGISLALSFPESALMGHAVAGGRLFFGIAVTGSLEIWVAEGDFSAPFRVLQKAVATRTNMWAAGDRVVFELTEPGFGMEPWVSDGTAAGTYRLGDLCPGECSAGPLSAAEVNGWLVLWSLRQVWLSEGSEDSAFELQGAFPGFLTGRVVPLEDRFLVPSLDSSFEGYLSAVEVTAPLLPPGEWLASPRVPGFRFKVRIGQTVGRQEPACLALTLCVGGVTPGRSEVFLREAVAVKLTPAPVEVWMQQVSTGFLRYHRLEAPPASSVLPGVWDRAFFFPASPAAVVEEAAAPRPPSGTWISDRAIQGFRVKARIGGRTVRAEPCAPGIVCLGAVKGQPEVLLRITGRQQNGFRWPMLARFTQQRVEVWIQQTKSGMTRYYKLEAVPAGSLALDGLVDRQGFRK